VKVVHMIVTEMAVIQVTPQGLVLEEIAPGLTPEDVQKATQPNLLISPNLKPMSS
jgi:3-oxoacid CoA-transferase subunit B